MHRPHCGIVVILVLSASVVLILAADLDDSPRCLDCLTMLDIKKFYLGQGYYPKATKTQMKNVLRKACEKHYPNLALACIEYESINLDKIQEMFPEKTNEDICRVIGHCVVQNEDAINNGLSL